MLRLYAEPQSKERPSALGGGAGAGLGAHPLRD
jgi:hypothetical protein